MTKRDVSAEQVREEQLARVEDVKAQLATRDDWRPSELSKLANYILAPELQNQRGNKRFIDEYPILSRRQIMRRQENCVSYTEE